MNPAEPTLVEHRLSAGARTLYVAECGEGAATVLLHGWPQTHWEWRGLFPLLAAAGRRSIAPDLPGLGASDAANGFETHAVAELLLLGLDALGVERFDLVGHDWGGPVGFAMACLAPDRVASLAVVDVVIPGDGRAAGLSQGGGRWHHLFHDAPGRLAETLTAGREKAYLDWFFDEYSETPDAIGPQARERYRTAYAAPGAMSAGFEYYRAAAADARWNADRLARHGRLTIPVLGVAGGAGRGRAGETAESLHLVAESVQAHVLADCGHLVPEERPRALADLLLAFWTGTASTPDR